MELSMHMQQEPAKSLEPQVGEWPSKKSELKLQEIELHRRILNVSEGPGRQTSAPWAEGLPPFKWDRNLMAGCVSSCAHQGEGLNF